MPERESSPAQRLLAGLERRRAAHRRRGVVHRAGVVALGAALVLGGLAMLVLPGPALLVLPAGLALLALEFVWAERLLRGAAERADRVGERLSLRAWVVLAVIAVALALAAGAFVLAR